MLVANIGDTRGYDIDLIEGKILQITRDDKPTIESVLITHPDLDREGAAIFLNMFATPNMVSDNLGNAHPELSKPKVDIYPLPTNHILLLCSEGLWKELSDPGNLGYNLACS